MAGLLHCLMGLQRLLLDERRAQQRERVIEAGARPWRFLWKHRVEISSMLSIGLPSVLVPVTAWEIYHRFSGSGVGPMLSTSEKSHLKRVILNWVPW